MQHRRKGRLVRTLFAVAVTLLVGGCEPAENVTGSQADLGLSGDGRFVGSWQLEAWTNGDGAERCSGEGRASGQLVYSADGHMSAQLGCAEVTLDIDETSDDPLGDLRSRMTRRHFSYYGSYTVESDRDVVVHHVLGSVAPNWVGSDQERAFVFESSDRLVLSPVGSEAKLTWRRNR